ncbi:MAG: hypothetical protein ACE5R6_03330 [Candidatus Heimdallarchaeota archaeon]
MSFIDNILSFLELTNPLVIIILLILSYQAIYSQWVKEKVDPKVYSFNKGKTEYKDPPRPHSTIFNEFLELILMSTTNKQRQLTHTFSRLINEQIDNELVSFNIQFSTSLKRLIEDPDAWFAEIYYQIPERGIFRKMHASETLHENFIKIFEELQDFFDFPLLTESE